MRDTARFSQNGGQWFRLKKALCVMSVSMLVLSPVSALAESAPVYDVDALPSQFDSGPDQSGPDVMTPPPDEGRAYGPSTRRGVRSSSFLGGSADTSPSSLDGRVKKLEQQIDTFRTTNVTPRVDSLQTEVQALRGQVELLTHQLQQLEEQQKAQYVDLDKRVT